MIHSDEAGQKMIDEIVADTETEWNDWEEDFISSTLRLRKYKDMTTKQKGVVSNLWDKRFGF